MAFPIALAIGALPEIVKLVTDLIERLNNNELTQEEFDAEWAKVVNLVVAAETRWDNAAKFDK